MNGIIKQAEYANLRCACAFGAGGVCAEHSGGDAGPRRVGAGRFQMGSSSQQAEELTREQQLADIEVCMGGDSD